MYRKFRLNKSSSPQTYVIVSNPQIRNGKPEAEEKLNLISVFSSLQCFSDTTFFNFSNISNFNEILKVAKNVSSSLVYLVALLTSVFYRKVSITFSAYHQMFVEQIIIKMFPDFLRRANCLI